MSTASHHSHPSSSTSKGSGFGLVPSCVVRPSKGPKREFSWFRLATDKASPVCRAECCSEPWYIPTTSSGTLPKPSQYHRKLMRRQSSGPWPSPQTISNYWGGLEWPPSCRALFNSAFIDSLWQAGVIFLTPISPKARQPRSMSLEEWAISASWLFPIELYLFCIILHCCLEVFASALNFSSSLILLSEYHDWIAYSEFCAFTPNMLKKKLPFLWGLCNRVSELHFLEGGVYGLAWQLKGTSEAVADSAH